MLPSDKELEKIVTEMNHLSLKRQQLLERKKIQCIFQEMRNRAEFRQTEVAASTLHDSIDDQLEQLAEREAELQRSRDRILRARDTKNEAGPASCQIVSDVPGVPGGSIFYVESPPNIPAPTVILDVEQLPHCPCRTQCPECKQYIITETFTSVSSVTWLVCFMAAMVGCVAGCCLIPFCMDSFKSTTHRCPKCRTAFKTVKKL
ncbi:cell death-inducing p53-target protein 1-like [Gasterosteus aculeatus]